MGKIMVEEPKKYKALTLPPKDPDPFVGYKTFEVEGYYVKHITHEYNGFGNPQTLEEFENEHTEHYIAVDSLADWDMPKRVELKEIDINTLEEVGDEVQ